MTQSDWIELSVALVCAVAASLLACVETAVSVISRTRAERMVADGARGAARIRLIAQDPAPSINAVMFTRMLFEIAAITLVALVVVDVLTSWWARIATCVGIMVVASFILWGVAPRTIGRQQPERVMGMASGIVSLLTTVLGPVAQLMVVIGNALTPGRGFADGPFASEAELREFVDIAEAAEVIEASESRMIHSVFELDDTVVKEVMVPRTDMVFIESDKTLRQMMSLALRSGFSRIPVIGGGIDDILGVAYLKDVTQRVHDNPDAERGETVRQHMRPASFVPDSKPVAQLLRDMQLKHSHLVVVIDEFGGTSGLVTIEDIIEEIVGEIVDEYDQELDAVVDLGEGRFRVSSRMAVDELGKLFGMHLDDDDVETVGGLMAKLLNLVPIPGSSTSYEGIEMVADKAVGRRHQIGTVLVRRAPDEELAEQAPDEENEE